MVSSARRIALLVAAVAGSLVQAAPAAADCNDPFARPNEVLDFHVRMKRADWMSLLASRVPSTDGNRAACSAQYPEFRAEFRCGNEPTWMKIAIRKKRGEERGVEVPLKPPLKLDFNEDFMGMVPEAKGQSWPAAFGKFGFRKLTMNNGQGNKPPSRSLMLPNLLSEHVALRLLRREIPSSPGTAFAKLLIYFDDAPQGEFHGLYLLIEDIDAAALRRRWGADVGRLVKYSKAGCPSEVQHEDMVPNAARTAFDAWIGRSPTSLDEAKRGIDAETALRQEAIREILVNGDDTLFFAGGDGNNYYLFDPHQGLRQYMPWDVDLTFGQQQQNCAPNSLKCPYTFPLLTWCTRNVSRIGRALACNSQIQRRYLEIMCQLTNGSLSAGEILKVWDEADAAARPGVGMEKALLWGGKDPLDPAIDKSYGAEYIRLKEWIPNRIRSVQEQITARGVACRPGCTAGAVEECSYLGCPGERRCEGNLWTTCRPRAACPFPMPQAGAPPVGGGSDAGGGYPGTGGTSGGDAGPAAGGAGGGGRDAGTGTADVRPGTTPPTGGGGASGGTTGGGGASGAGGGSAGAGPGPGTDPPGPGQPGPRTGKPDGGCQCALYQATDEQVPGVLGAFVLGALLTLVRRSRRGQRRR
jgi:hypothetical protein